MNAILWLSLYFGGFAFFTYACIIADPNTSPLSHFLTRRVPDLILSYLRHLVGPKIVRSIEDATEYALVGVYLLIVLGCWSIMFTHGYDMIASSTYVSDVHMYVGYAVFVACGTSWRLASRTSPGVVTSRTIAKFDNYPYDNCLFAEAICPTAKIRKIARSKYDRITQRHIARFDHYCGWINNAVGEENYRWFLLFLAVHVGMCWYGSLVMGWAFLGLVEGGNLMNATFFVAETGEEVRATKGVVAQYLIATHFWLAACFLIMAVMALALTLFLAFHLYISARGMTTNEYYKWKQVRRWHKKAKQMYEQARKEREKEKALAEAANKGKVEEGQGGVVGELPKKKEMTMSRDVEGRTASSSSSSLLATVPVNDDADVGCIGPTSGSAAASISNRNKLFVVNDGSNGDNDDDDDDDDDNASGDAVAALDPGPFPKNIYDRGLYENFCEIVHPRSLREDALSRWRDYLRREEGIGGGGRGGVVVAGGPMDPSPSPAVEMGASAATGTGTGMRTTTAMTMASTRFGGKPKAI